jgi:hypothetical protein
LAGQRMNRIRIDRIVDLLRVGQMPDL